MRLVLIEDAGAIHAVRLGSVERILAPGEPDPPGLRQADLRVLLGFPASLDTANQAGRHRLVLAGAQVALSAGRALATITLDPERILPLPGYMFAVRTPPYRGAFACAPLAERLAGQAAGIGSQVGLVLQEEALLDTKMHTAGPATARLRPGSGRRSGEPAQAGNAGKVPHLLVLSAGGAQVGVPLSAARQVLAGHKITPVGRARPHVAGLIVHDGKAIPVYHLDHLVPGAARAGGAAGQIVVLEEEGALAGFLVDTVHALRQAETAPPLVVQGQDLMRAAGAGTSRGGMTQAAGAAEGE